MFKIISYVINHQKKPMFSLKYVETKEDVLKYSVLCNNECLETYSIDGKETLYIIDTTIEPLQVMNVFNKCSHITKHELKNIESKLIKL